MVGHSTLTFFSASKEKVCIMISRRSASVGEVVSWCTFNSQPYVIRWYFIELEDLNFLGSEIDIQLSLAKDPRRPH